MKKKEEATVATEVGENQEPQMQMEDDVITAKELRKRERQMCNNEIAQVLEKYGCELTAQIVVGKHRVIPQVFVIDTRS
jgi:hypothetical protein